ncbi:MAG: sugar phosphate isomerase/epimerase [Lachnospiraceae bacterium]|nr:sugar phosphate isomerase/epimerase [Lachnospiraceae bacterium]
MRIGGGIEKAYHNPEEWMKFAKDLRYSAVLCPVDSSSDQATRREYLKAAREADLLIGEVGVWRNCLAKDEMTRKAAMDYAKAQLALADEMGANCCVNIIGSHSETAWDGFSAENYSDDFYALAVDSVREIIDAVKPTNTFYTIEPMPWVPPDSPEQYLKLIQDVDRKEFAVHLDFVNMINCPERFCKSTEFVKHCFDLLGPYIKSIHCKDSVMEQAYTAVIHETMPGKGTLDYKKILPLVENLGKDIPLFVEHLPDYETYRQAVAFVRAQAESVGILVKG